MSSTDPRAPCPPLDESEMISTANLSHPPTISIPSVPYPSNSHYVQQQPQPRQRYRSLSGSEGSYPAAGAPPIWGGENMNNANMNRRPSLPVNQHQPQLQQQYQNGGYNQQYQYHNAHQSRYSQHQQHQMMRDQQQHHQQQQPLTPSTPSTTNAPV
ncbi:hypothetical protein BGX27_001334, partial [Mortierella sp. AM989]